jgi:hypothetical protein
MVGDTDPITESGNTAAAKNVADFFEGLLLTKISACGGTSPTLDLTLQTYDGTNWFTHTTIAQQTSTASVVTPVSMFGEDVRLAWVIGGTGSPSFTFTSKFVAKS